MTCKKSSAETTVCTVPQGPTFPEGALGCLSLARSDAAGLSVGGGDQGAPRQGQHGVGFLCLGGSQWRIAGKGGERLLLWVDRRGRY